MLLPAAGPARPSRLVVASLSAAAVVLSLPVAEAGAQLVRSATGLTAADAALNAQIGTFEADVGAPRRRIRWDGVPDARSAPNPMPPNQFQGAGNLYSTPGTELQVSANPGVAPVDFATINPTYETVFEPFSQEKLFTSIGSNIIDVHFVLAGTTTPGVTNGFGVVFSDVDLANTTSIELFAFNGTSLGTFFAPAITGDQTFSFLGISYASPVIGRARITQGNAALGANALDGPNDLVVTDDFIFGEVAAVPEPSTWALLGAGLLALGAAARRRSVAGA